MNVLRQLAQQQDIVETIGRSSTRFAIETGKGYWMPTEVDGTLRCTREIRPSRPSCVIYTAGVVEGAHGVTLIDEIVSTIQGIGGKAGQGYAAVLIRKGK